MNVKAPSRVDSWVIAKGVGQRNFYILKNGKSILAATSFEKAWDFILKQGTSGDRIEINVKDGVLS